MSKKYDIIVIGAGTAGMTCAIEASKQGAQVAVIEKDSKPGGAMHWSGGHMSAGGTQLQKRQGIEDSIEDHLNDVLRIANGTGDLNLIKKAVESAPNTLNWLDDLGFDWAPECPRIIYGHVPYTKPRTQYGQEKALSIFNIISPLWEKGVASNNIDCFYDCEFIGVNKSDAVFDTVLYKTNGELNEIKGDAIVLTTGGYGSNPDFFKSKHGDIPLVSSAYPNSTGEAMMIMENIGAEFHMSDYHLPSLGGVELSPGRANFNEAWAMVLTSVYRQPRDIYINLEGHRFMAEDEINADTREREVVKQKDWQFWVVFDEDALMERSENGSENPIMIGWNTEKIKAIAKEEKFILTSDSLDGLCKKMNLDFEVFKDTIDTFNACVDNGEDSQWGRTYLKNKIVKAPFYAIKVHASVLVTFGGLKVNEDLEILDTMGKPLKGIYGAGEVLGLGALSGNAFCSGMAITPALSFGKILGKSLSQ